MNKNSKDSKKWLLALLFAVLGIFILVLFTRRGHKGVEDGNGLAGAEKSELVTEETARSEAAVPETVDQEVAAPETDDNEATVPETNNNEATVPETSDNEPAVPETNDNEPAVPRSDDSEQGGLKEGVSAGLSASGQKLLDFCKDQELNDWFNDAKEKPPVKLSYTIHGEAPILFEITDRDLILKTVEALKTVEIDGPARENPENVADGSGNSYYFTMEDGSNMGFSFMMGAFRWKQGDWHGIASYGDLSAVSEELREYR